MKTRKNVRDSFKNNDKIADLSKDEFSIISIEKNEEDRNDINVNYQYFDDSLKTELISLKKEKWLYEGIMTSGYHTELLFGSIQFEIFGYSDDVKLVNPLLSNVSIGDINPTFNVSICTEPGETGYKFVVFGLIEDDNLQNIIVSVNDIEYVLNYQDNFGVFSNVLMIDDNIFEDGVEYEIKIKYV